MTVQDLLAPSLDVRTRQHGHRVPVVGVVAVDLLVIVLVVLVAALGRMLLPFFDETGDLDRLVAIVAAPLVAGWTLSILLHGGYATHVLGAGSEEYKLVTRATLVTAGALGVASFLTKLELSRGFFFLLLLVGLPALVLGRLLARRGLHRLRRRGLLTHRVLITGSPEHIDEVAAVLARERWLGYEVVGALVPAARRPSVTPGGIPVLAGSARLAAVVDETACDIVLFAAGAVGNAQEMRRAAWELGDRDVQIMLVPSLTDVATDRVRIRPAAGLHLMELEGPRAHRAAHLSKRAFDIVGASAGLLLAAPLLVVSALAVRLHDGGPVLFRQSRVGRAGELFDCYKFRSMVVGADRLTAQVADQNHHDADHVLFKAPRDPRITPPGRLLRRFSVDEVPQFLNVLRGEMSLIGPRPSLPEEVERYSDDVRTRLTVRPGMTGLWQVSGRSDLSWEDSVRLVLYYVDNWSLVQDLSILWRTVSAVLVGRGAY